jgi:hypothetical protein
LVVRFWIAVEGLLRLLSDFRVTENGSSVLLRHPTIKIEIALLEAYLIRFQSLPEIRHEVVV